MPATTATPADSRTPGTVYRGEEVFTVLSRLADGILESGFLDDDAVVVGIANGGVVLGNLLHRLLRKQSGLSLAYGVVETSFHRDDIGARPIPIVAHPTDIPVNIEGRKILLVDDVIASGRTIRAAVNEIFDQGRPGAVALAVLFDRGGRRLPVQPDFLGEAIEAGPELRLDVHIDEEDPSAHQVQLLDR